MSERLTIRLPNGGVMYDNGEYWAVCYPWNEHCLRDIDRMAIKLCDVEDKIEQGDVVEVVRCKDCKFNVANMEIDENDGTDYSGEDIVCSYFMTDGLEPNDYCNRGKRREE